MLVRKDNMMVDGFGEAVRQAIATKKSGSGQVPHFKRWAIEIMYLLQDAVKAGEVKAMDVIPPGMVLAQLQKNDKATHLKKANCIGDAMGIKGLGMQKGTHGYMIPYTWPEISEPTTPAYIGRFGEIVWEGSKITKACSYMQPEVTNG